MDRNRHNSKHKKRHGGQLPSSLAHGAPNQAKKAKTLEEESLPETESGQAPQLTDVREVMCFEWRGGCFEGF